MLFSMAGYIIRYWLSEKSCIMIHYSEDVYRQALDIMSIVKHIASLWNNTYRLHNVYSLVFHKELLQPDLHTIVDTSLTSPAVPARFLSYSSGCCTVLYRTNRWSTSLSYSVRPSPRPCPLMCHYPRCGITAYTSDNGRGYNSIFL